MNPSYSRLASARARRGQAGGRRRTARPLVALVISALLLPVAAPAMADPGPTSYVFDNGRLRFGGGGHEDPVPEFLENSVNDFGNLQQPFYRSANGNWYKLTFSNFPLDLAIGVGTGGDNWTTSTVAENPPLTGQVVDTSGFIETSVTGAGAVGHGRLVSTGTADLNGSDVEVRNTYELGADAAFLKVTTRIQNMSGAQVDNVHLWVGTRDDYVGEEDEPAKTKGNLVNGSFVPIDDPTTPAQALQITTEEEGVLFYSTTAGANTVIAEYLNRSTFNATRFPPAGSPIAVMLDDGHDGSYALHLPVGDLADGVSAEIVWYYAAGSLDDLEDVIRDVADAAAPAPARPTVEIGNGEVTVTWDEPVSDEPITDYAIRYRSDASENWTVVRRGSVALPLQHTITDLQNGRSYEFQVAAVTGTGEDEVRGDWSPSSSVAVPGVPVNLTAPKITGNVNVGGLLTVVDPDTNWRGNTGGPVAVTYQWQADGVAIEGATDRDFLLTAAQAGKAISVVVTRASVHGATSASSAATAVVPSPADLSWLGLSGGVLHPDFKTAITRYDATVGHDTLAVTLLPKAFDLGAVVTINGKELVEGSKVPLEVGANTITVRVVSHGDVSEYVLTVTRAAAPKPDPKPHPKPNPQPSPEPSPRSTPEPVRNPAGQLPKVGTGQALVGGKSVTVEVVPVPTSGGVAVRGEGFELEVSPEGGSNPARPPQQHLAGVDLSFARGQAAEVSVKGFAPKTPVSLWLFSEPKLLGTFETDDAGALLAATDGITADVAACQHTLHAQGELPSGEMVELSLGVWVDADPFPFADTSSRSPHARAVACLTDLGVIKGTGASTFAPAGSVTRGQTASLVARLAGLDTTGSSTFRDARGGTHEGAIAAVTSAGLVVGYRDGTFRPGETITRGQLSSVLARLAGLDATGTPASSDAQRSAHAGAIAALTEIGAVSGYADGSFRPGHAVKRDQAASMLMGVQAVMRAEG